MFRRLITVVLIILTVLLFSACGAATKNKQLLVGKWQAETEGSESETFGYAFAFEKDGTITYDLSGLEEFGVEGEEFDEGVEAIGNVMSLNYEVADEDTIEVFAKMFGMKGDPDKISYQLVDENTLVLDGVTYIRVQ
jgi:hypothetical protein